MRLGSLLWNVCTATIVFIVNFLNTMTGTCINFLQSLLLIIKNKLLVEIHPNDASNWWSSIDSL